MTNKKNDNIEEVKVEEVNNPTENMNLPVVNVPNLLAKFDEKLASYTELRDKTPATTGKFRWNPGFAGVNVNIFECDDIELLIDVYSYIEIKHIAREQSITNIQEKLQGKVTLPNLKPFNWLGFPFSSWAEDIIHRIYIIISTGDYAELVEGRKEVKSYLSKEDKITALANKFGL